MTDGLAVIDKPAGITSHGVVARLRRVLGVRRIGHAGTLDPMATGVLVCGVGRATRLLGHLVADDKEYLATIRLGVATVTDDAEGEPIGGADASAVTESAIRAAMLPFTGAIEQVPSAVSAVKIDGVRSYARVRRGEAVALTPRPVTVSRFDLLDIRFVGAVVDLDVAVTCSSGTYIRALARDLGESLGVGGHLTALRRTRSGPFTVAMATELEQFTAEPRLLEVAAVLQLCFPRLDVDADAAGRLRHGGRLTGDERPAGLPAGPIGVFGPGDEPLALMSEDAAGLRPLVVLAG